MFLEIIKEFRISPAYMAFLVDMQFRTALLSGRSPADFPMKIQIVGIKDTFVYVIVKSSFGDRHTVSIFGISYRQRYPVFYEWDHGCGYVFQLGLTE